MPYVLGAMEHPESEPGEEVARRQVASYRPNDEARASLEKLRYVLQLGDVVLPVATILLQQLEVLIELLASMTLIQFAQLFEYNRPGSGLLFGVLNSGNGIPIVVIERNVRELFAALPVNGILEAL